PAIRDPLTRAGHHEDFAMRFSRLRRVIWLSVLICTASKKASMGARRLAMPWVAAWKSSIPDQAAFYPHLQVREVALAGQTHVPASDDPAANHRTGPGTAWA
ncbi:hypothetical protein VB636_06950, partial [Paracoccus sp. APAP_BH8]|uniref:hypothetical protein n=1 Tax=Paracoccus sp. APAP_BH8 TaxID=3110237 RepID=UPI002FD7FA2F